MENKTKTYRAIRHDVVRKRQKSNHDELHHPDEKINQIINHIPGNFSGCILELFSGHGNLTKLYSQLGDTIAVDNNKIKYNHLVELGLDGVEVLRKDSFKLVHKFISEGRKFNIIDIDPYGFPNRFFPHIFLLMENGYMFVTMPKPYVNILNGITAAHLISYYGEQNPNLDTIVNRIVLFGICHWRKVYLLDCIDCKSVWRMCFKVSKVKATDYTGVKNR